MWENICILKIFNLLDETHKSKLEQTEERTKVSMLSNNSHIDVFVLIGFLVFISLLLPLFAFTFISPFVILSCVIRHSQ